MPIRKKFKQNIDEILSLLRTYEPDASIFHEEYGIIRVCDLIEKLKHPKKEKLEDEKTRKEFLEKQKEEAICKSLEGKRVDNTLKDVLGGKSFNKEMARVALEQFKKGGGREMHISRTTELKWSKRTGIKEIHLDSGKVRNDREK